MMNSENNIKEEKENTKVININGIETKMIKCDNYELRYEQPETKIPHTKWKQI